MLVKRPRPDGEAEPTSPSTFFAHPLRRRRRMRRPRGGARPRRSACWKAARTSSCTSVGAFTDTALFDRLLAAAKANGRRLILPSAGIGALDILSSAAVGGLDSVTVTVRKDPSAWNGTVAETLCDLDDAHGTERSCSTVRCARAPRLYPQNVNISAAAAIAGLGLDRTRVVIVADPDHHRAHRRARGEQAPSAASPSSRTSAVSEENRKTGKLVAMAMVKSVRQLASTLVVAA